MSIMRIIHQPNIPTTTKTYHSSSKNVCSQATVKPANCFEKIQGSLTRWGPLKMKQSAILWSCPRLWLDAQNAQFDRVDERTVAAVPAGWMFLFRAFS